MVEVFTRRKIITILVVVAALLLAYFAFVRDGASAPQGFVTHATPTVDEVVSARAILAAEPSFIAVVGDQEWQMLNADVRHWPTGEYTAQFGIEWASPVDTRGPWVLTNCRGTRRDETYLQWYDLTQMVATIDLNARAVTQLHPGSVRPSEIATASWGRVDREEQLAAGGIAPCLPGLQDDRTED